MLENGVQGKEFGNKREEIAGDCEKCHNDELRGLYCPPDIVMVINLR
jgi:hypothetical protein